MYVCTYKCLCACVCLCMLVYASICACMYVHEYICLMLRMYACKSVGTYVLELGISPSSPPTLPCGKSQKSKDVNVFVNAHPHAGINYPTGAGDDHKLGEYFHTLPRIGAPLSQYRDALPAWKIQPLPPLHEHSPHAGGHTLGRCTFCFAPRSLSPEFARTGFGMLPPRSVCPCPRRSAPDLAHTLLALQLARGAG